MNIYLSSATIQSYENKDKSMDLFFNPIVIFEGFKGFSIEQLKNISWKIESEKIGLHEFDIHIIEKPQIEISDDKNFVEFKLSKREVAFQYDNYPCKIRFNVTIDGFEEKALDLEYEVLGIVKTKWSKGLL